MELNKNLVKPFWFIDIKTLVTKGVSQKYITDLLKKKTASASTYQKGSMDELLIQKFLEKQKIKDIDLYKLDKNLEDNNEENSEIKENQKDE